ncbi:periplasmic heavy metal sensor [candidate division KSB3 bacterium]|nr:periplasmic heavy metal sensor [candidate division KSB3 bacterium]
MKRTAKTLVIVTIVAVGIGGALTVFARGHRDMGQRGSRPERFQSREDQMSRGHAWFQQLAADLNLSDEQKQQILTIVIKHRMNSRDVWQNALEDHQQLAELLLTQDFDEAQVRQMYQEQAAEREKQREDMFVERAKMLADIKAVLTPEQVEMLEQKGMDMFQNWLDKPGKRAEPEEGVRGRGRLPRLTAELNLSEEQQQQLITIFSQYQANRMNAWQNFVDTSQELADMLLTEDFDEQHVRDFYQQRAAEREDIFVERAKMLTEMTSVLTPDQKETLKQEGIDWFGMPPAPGAPGHRPMGHGGF